jgi:predicted RNA binding protein YcfA (HicA-like mRNA interferase family)
MASDISALLRALEREGWRATPLRRGHTKLVHPKAARVVFASTTPSDTRALYNILADCRRALKEGPRD